MEAPYGKATFISRNPNQKGTQSHKAYPEEKVGVFCKKNGKPYVIEYSEIPEQMAEETDEEATEEEEA